MLATVEYADGTTVWLLFRLSILISQIDLSGKQVRYLKATCNSMLPVDLGKNMNKTGDKKRTLRAKAEERLACIQPPASKVLLTNGALHELQVHQIELEMQNEQLQETQVALEESRDHYQDLYNFAPVGYFTLNDKGQITEVNLAGASLLRRQKKALNNQPFADYLSPKDRDAWQQSFSHAMVHEEKQYSLVDLLREDGNHLTAHLEFRRMGHEDATRALRISMTNVSVMKGLIDDLQRREDRLQLAKNATGFGVFDHDLITGAHYFDERLCQIWGFRLDPLEPITRAQVIGGIHPEDRQTIQELIEKALDPHHNGKYGVEYRVVSQADGSVRDVIANGQVFFKDGRAVRFVGTVRDVSPQKRLEKELQLLRMEMEQLVNQQVAAQTAAAIAHEINQPLVAISAYSEAALRMLESGAKDPDKLTRALRGAMEQSQRAGQSLQELLELLHQGETTMENVDLNQVVEEAVSMAKTNWLGGFQSVLELESNLPPVIASPLIIKKVLLNLLHNGLEAMRIVGTAEQAISILVRTRTESRMAQITVRDNGPGLAPELVESLFKPFFSTKPKGMGFGLPISKSLIESCGGKLWLDQEAGSGAIFHFTLPFAA